MWQERVCREGREEMLRCQSTASRNFYILPGFREGCLCGRRGYVGKGFGMED